MSWQQATRFNNYTLLQWAVGDAKGWIIRGPEELFAVDPKTFAEKWRIPLDAVPFMYKGVILTAQLAITPQTQSDSDTKLLAFDRQTGHQVWQHKIGWQGRRNYGGVVLHNEYLAFMEKKGENLHFVMADAKTGKQIRETEGFAVPGAGPSPGSPRSLVVSQGHVYIIYSKTGLYRCKLSEKEDFAFERVLEGRPLCIQSDQQYIYSAFQKEVVQIDAMSGKVLGRVALPENTEVESMIAMPGFGTRQTSGQVALLFGPDKGMLFVDFSGKNWRVNESSGWYVIHAAATPHGVVAVLNERAKPLYILDRAKGAVKEELAPEKDQRWEGMIYWMGEALLADYSAGARVLVWQDDGKTGLRS